MLIHRVSSLWESDLMSFPMSVCFWPPPCSLYVTFIPAPPKATYIFFGDKSMSLNPADSMAVVQSQCRATLSASPQGPTSWSQQHQRDPGSRGWVEPDLTLLRPLHHNVWVCSHSLTLTFSMICVYQWCPPPKHTHMSLPLLPDTQITQFMLVRKSDLN